MVVDERPLLIAGAPRSGSSWVGRTIAQATAITYVHEPDNEKRDPYAMRAKRGLGRFPVVAPDADEPAYDALWRGAFAGGEHSTARRHRFALAQYGKTTRELLERAISTGTAAPRIRAAALAALPRTAPAAPGRVVVKSVHASLALSWIRRRFDPHVVVVLRHPLNVLASMLDLDMHDRDRHLDRSPAVLRDYAGRWGAAPPGPGASPLRRAAWQTGLLQSALAEQDDVALVVVHEELCTDPPARFRALFDDLSIPWREAVSEHVREWDQPGGGFNPRRVAADQPERWRRRFDDADVAEIRSVLEAFPFPGWPNDGSPP